MTIDTIYQSLLFLFLTSGFLCLILTPAVKLFAIQTGILRKPGTRTVHSKPMPLLGGLAIFMSASISLALMNLFGIGYFNITSFEENKYIPVIAGALAIMIVGIIDDVRGMKASTKFIAQFAVALAVWHAGIRLDLLKTYTGSEIPFLNSGLSLIFTIFWLLAFTNAINLIDGLDGLATGISSIAFLSLGVVALFNDCFVQSYICFAVGGAAIAFLKYNFNPAKIFLGDTGSLSLGFLLGGVSITGSMKTATIGTILVSIVLMGLPVLDTSLSIIRRVLKNINIFQADKEHIHHKLLDMGLSHRRAVIILYCVSLIFAVSAVYISFSTARNIGFVVLIFSGMAYVALNKLGYKEYLKLIKYRNSNGTKENVPFEIQYFNLVSKMNLAVTPEKIWEHAVKILKLIGFERVSLHMLNHERTKLSTIFTWSIDPDKIKHIMKEYEKITRDQKLGQGGSIVSYALSLPSHDIMVVRDKEEMRGKVSDQILDNIAADEFICIPLMGTSGMLGAIIADKYFTNNRIEEDEIALLASLSSLIIAVIERNSLLSYEGKEIILSNNEVKLRTRNGKFEHLH